MMFKNQSVIRVMAAESAETKARKISLRLFKLMQPLIDKMLVEDTEIHRNPSTMSSIFLTLSGNFCSCGYGLKLLSETPYRRLPQIILEGLVRMNPAFYEPGPTHDPCFPRLMLESDNLFHSFFCMDLDLPTPTKFSLYSRAVRCLFDEINQKYTDRYRISDANRAVCMEHLEWFVNHQVEYGLRNPEYQSNVAKVLFILVIMLVYSEYTLFKTLAG